MFDCGYLAVCTARDLGWKRVHLIVHKRSRVLEQYSDSPSPSFDPAVLSGLTPPARLSVLPFSWFFCCRGWVLSQMNWPRAASAQDQGNSVCEGSAPGTSVRGC